MSNVTKRSICLRHTDHDSEFESEVRSDEDDVEVYVTDLGGNVAAITLTLDEAGQLFDFLQAHVVDRTIAALSEPEPELSPVGIDRTTGRVVFYLGAGKAA